MNTADSITAIRINGRVKLLVTIMMMTKIATMETALTTWKSTEVSLIMSWVVLASPTSRAVSS